MLHEFVAHLNAEHPGVNIEAAIDFEYVDLTADDDDEDSLAAGEHWRCKTCEQVFDAFDAAVSQVDSAHPDRVAVDVRNAVEAI